MAEQDFNYGTEAPQGFDASTQSPQEGGSDEFMFEEEKKPINRNVIALLLIVLVGGGGLYVMYNRGGLGSQKPMATPGDQAAMEWLGGASKELGEMRRSLDETRRMVRMFDRIGKRPQVAVSELKSNPFVLMQSAGPQIVETGASGPDMEKLRKQVLAMEDMKGLHVQSVMAAGPNSSCVINKTVLRVGQQIVSGKTEFTIERVEASRISSSVVLSAYGQQFTKAMEKSKP